jgi:hypothetical protein
MIHKLLLRSLRAIAGVGLFNVRITLAGTITVRTRALLPKRSRLRVNGNNIRSYLGL